MSVRAWLYHRTEPPRLVTDPHDYDRLLREGWADTPAAFNAPESATEPIPPVRRRTRRKE